MRILPLIFVLTALASSSCQTQPKREATGDARMLQKSEPEIHGEVGATYSHTSGR